MSQEIKIGRSIFNRNCADAAVSLFVPLPLSQSSAQAKQSASVDCGVDSHVPVDFWGHFQGQSIAGHYESLHDDWEPTYEMIVLSLQPLARMKVRIILRTINFVALLSAGGDHLDIIAPELSICQCADDGRTWRMVESKQLPLASLCVLDGSIQLQKHNSTGQSEYKITCILPPWQFQRMEKLAIEHGRQEATHAIITSIYEPHVPNKEYEQTLYEDLMQTAQQRPPPIVRR